MPAVFWVFFVFFPGNCLHGQNPSIRKMIWELSLRVYPVLPCLVAHSVQHSSGVSLELLRYKRCRREVQAASKGKICITLALAKRNGLPADHKLPLYLSWHRPCPTAQRSYLGGFSIPKRGWLSKGTRRNKEPVQSGHWAPFDGPTNGSWQDETLRREMTTKGLCWSAQHTLRVTLSCPSKGFSSQQRGTKPQSPECSAHSLSLLLALHPVPEINPKLTDKICLFPHLSISWQWKVNLFLGNKAFFSPFPAFP